VSHPEIIESCKKVIIQYLLDAIGQRNIVSIILYGSVSRNEESYKYKGDKLYLESDIDVLVVVKNRMIVLKSWLILKSLSNAISNKLRESWLLSFVSLSITTEERLLNESPDFFRLSLKFNGRVIYGKELIGLMSRYEYNEHRQIPPSQLKWTIFAEMVKVVRSIASSGIIDGKVSLDGYNSVLKSIRRLTLYMVRTIIVKDSTPLNPYDLIEIKTKRKLYKIKHAELFEDLLKSHDDIKLRDAKEDYSIDEVERCLSRVIKQVNSTMGILTGTKDPFVRLPKKVIFGYTPLIQRVEYSMFILLTNFFSGSSVGLFKYIIAATFRHEDTISRFYDLFISSSNLIKSLRDEGITNNQKRRSWLKLYRNTLKPWEYAVN
jgi:predicted nucleotidyltransferase